MSVSSCGNLNIFFVLPSKYQSKHECSPFMLDAYEECIEHSLQPMWLTEAHCKVAKPVKTDVYVLEKFEGSAFEKLKEMDCSIVGPKCLLYCFDHGQPIPEGGGPIYTVAMTGFCVCSSGVTVDVKEHIRERVSYMGGLFTKQLRSSVTHLVTESVMSSKYENAVENNMKIYTKEWVDAVWNANLDDLVMADDARFDKYKAPVFYNLVVTCTNITKNEKAKLAHLINENGGTFMGALDGSKVKVLIAPLKCPITEKLQFAKKINVACLTPDWVYDSVKRGYALPFKNYLIQSLKVSSTPEKETPHESINCSTISAIFGDAPQKNYVDETLGSTCTNLTQIESMSRPSGIQGTIDRLIFSEAKLAGPFLDGCTIYLAGFTSNHKDRINRILNVGGATRLDDISDALTHVIIGDENRASSDVKQMTSEGLCPCFLSLKWLEESIKLKRPAPEEKFLFEFKNTTARPSTEPPSPLSKKNLQMLQKARRPPIPPFNIDKKSSKCDSDSNLVQEYYHESTVPTDDAEMHCLSKPHGSSEEENIDKTVMAKSAMEKTKVTEVSELEQNKDAKDESSVPISQPTFSEKLFEGMTFLITGFSQDESHVEQSILLFGGKIVPIGYTGIPDYGVVPLCGAPLKHTVNEIVTNLFIEDCITQEQLVEIQHYHRPLLIKNHSNPLSGCVITMSMYSGVERAYLTGLAVTLGAKCQNVFVRKTNIERNSLGNTHLVCPMPDGNKYKAAVKWKLPAVTAGWLRECAAQGKLVDEAPYVVGEAVAPERDASSSKANSTANAIGTEGNLLNDSASRKILTPIRHLPLQNQEFDDAGTPLVNKALALVKNQSTNKSPYQMISTPDSPYGQVFKPDPSPATRKAWAEWIADFPDLREDKPPVKQRAPSTPLSELKRKLWQEIKVQSHAEAYGDVPSTSKDATPENKNRTSEIGQIPINRQLEYPSEGSPMLLKDIGMQVAYLDQVLEQTSTILEKRYSLSGENAQGYSLEPVDPIEKCILRDTQPIETVVWEDFNHSKHRARNKTLKEPIEQDESEIENLTVEMESEFEPQKKRRFMLSGFKEKAAHEQVIQKLGGEVSPESSFDKTATHVLCLRPGRNEKVLGSIASGKWVLHYLYLRDCEVAGEFLDEEKYEWGNPKSRDTIPEPTSETERIIAQAAYRWRIELEKSPSGPFSDMVALLLMAPDKHEQFQRLIEAGGGTVVQARPPYDTSPGSKKITHCFVNVKQVKQPIDWAMLASKGILCFLPEYLSNHLTAETPLNPRQCVLPEFKKYLTLLPK